VNYAELVQLVQDYSETTETSFVSHIPDFVRAAEERIYNAVHIPAIRKNSIGQVTANNAYLTLPADWLATFSLAVQLSDPISEEISSVKYQFLLEKDVNFIREAFPNPLRTGVPTHYAQFDANTLILGPTPDSNYGAELHYYYYPETIVTAGTSWIGDNFKNVLLYGTLREAYLYQKGEADITALYEEKYQEAMLLLKKLGDGKNRRDTYRSGQVREPVT